MQSGRIVFSVEHYSSNKYINSNLHPGA